jgi:small subunit ribosomal protein S20
MANHPSALKRHRQSVKKRANNNVNRHKLKTQMKKIKNALGTGKADDAKTLLPETFSKIDKSVQKGVLTKNAASRYKSRLNKSVNTIGKAASASS